MLPTRPGDNRGNPNAGWRTPAADAAAQELLAILFRSGWTLCTLAEEMPCGKSALSTYARAERHPTPEVIQALLRIVAHTVAAVSEPLRQTLVLLGYELSLLTPFLRWDTISIDVPRPTAWLRHDHPYFGLPAADVLRAQVELWLRSVVEAAAPTKDAGSGAFRVEMYGIREEHRHQPHELHPLERPSRRIRVSLDPFQPKSDIWLRVQFAPLHRDHQWFVGELLLRLGLGVEHVRVSRFDAAFDMLGTLDSLVPVVGGKRKHRLDPPRAGLGRAIRDGTRRTGSWHTRVYERPFPWTEGPEVRAEWEWKPKRFQRPRLLDLGAVTCPLDDAIEVLPVRFVGRSLGDRELLQRLARGGLVRLSPRERLRLRALRDEAREAGVAFDLGGELRRLWTPAMVALRDLILACRHRASSRRMALAE